MGLKYEPNLVKKNKKTPELKNIYAYSDRTKALEGVFTCDPIFTREKSILLFDDLFRSGATITTITKALYEVGLAKDVYALTITKTRSNR